jgi:hypothetical protein
MRLVGCGESDVVVGWMWGGVDEVGLDVVGV